MVTTLFLALALTGPISARLAADTTNARARPAAGSTTGGPGSAAKPLAKPAAKPLGEPVLKRRIKPE